jgi:hypothetical protein
MPHEDVTELPEAALQQMATNGTVVFTRRLQPPQSTLQQQFQRDLSVLRRAGNLVAYRHLPVTDNGFPHAYYRERVDCLTWYVTEGLEDVPDPERARERHPPNVTLARCHEAQRPSERTYFRFRGDDRHPHGRWVRLTSDLRVEPHSALSALDVPMPTHAAAPLYLTPPRAPALVALPPPTDVFS